MKITIDGQLFIDDQNKNGLKEITIGKASNDVDFVFVAGDETHRIRINRAELSKVLEILDQGLM